MCQNLFLHFFTTVMIKTSHSVLPEQLSAERKLSKGITPGDILGSIETEIHFPLIVFNS
jgi:hypothetical protein